jgi:hypothetical protein
MNMDIIVSHKKMARTAGGLYLLLAMASIFGLVYVPSKLVVPQDIQATLQNITASPMMFRYGIISNLIYLVVFVFLVLAFYNLFKEVHRQYALLMVALVLVAVPVAFLNELNKFAVLVLLGREGSLKSFDSGNLQAMMQLFLNLYEYGSYMVMMFWGLWLFPLGLLVVKSKFIPPILGILLMIGCCGYVVSSFAFLFSPIVGRMIFPIATIPSAFAEVALILWLLIKGVRAQIPMNR